MNSILFWNSVSLEANRQAHTDGLDRGALGPTLSARAFAIVHLAMYDAYAAVRRAQGASAADLPPYLNVGTPPAGANELEAAAGAAFTTLSALYASQQQFFDSKKNEAGIAPGDPGASFRYGQAVAHQLLGQRRFDPDSSDLGYQPSPDRGRHRLDPDNRQQGYFAPYYGALSRGFAITKRHVLEAPPSPFQGRPGHSEYLAALEQVRCKGIKPELAGTLPGNKDRRDPTETLVGIFWAYDGAAGLGTPPRLYNQIVRQVAEAQDPNNNDRHARLFALVNAAMADAGILAWDQKYQHDLWRPVVGIREHDPSLGPDSPDDQPSSQLIDDADPFWLPLGAPRSNVIHPKNFTPNFPAYPSGHATFGAAALHMTRLFYKVKAGDRKKDSLCDGLSFVSDELDGKTTDNAGTQRPRHERRFKDGLWQMILENGLSRVFLGVHWVFDAFALKGKEPDLTRNVGGIPLGLAIAEDIFQSGLKPSPVGPRTDFPSSLQ